MPDRLELRLYPVRPHRIFITILLIAFATESLVMSMLPFIVPKGTNRVLESLVDAFLMTLMSAPLIWYTVVRPIERLSQSRMKFLRRSMMAQENERHRIKQELHDGLGQTLTSMMLGLRAIEETTTDQSVVDIVHRLRTSGAGIHDDLRRIVAGLHPAILEQGGLVDAVSFLLDQLRNVSTAEFSLSTQGFEDQRFDRNYETLVYRIVQEALNNAVKHSGATLIRVEMSFDVDALRLKVTDNGCGFIRRSHDKSSYGLIGLRERALALGGHIEIVTGKTGTSVIATLPALKREEQKKL